ncbi:MAG: SMI1/KNR4 family protein [Myxococcales bacterium]|nr:SMI1/KNR4 family protein [Myxococcales bacterium]
MREWIVGLQKGAQQAGPGIRPEEWAGIEAASGVPVPLELRELYQAFDGAFLAPDVRLFRFRAEGKEAGVLERSRAPGKRGWSFGLKGESEPLFAARKMDLLAQGMKVPEWLQPLPDNEWCYGFVRADGEVRQYRTLEQLLARLVPPFQTEEFGDITYTAALSAVAGTVEAIAETPRRKRTPKPKPKRAKRARR